MGLAAISLNHYGAIGFSTNSIGVRGEATAGSSAGVSGAQLGYRVGCVWRGIWWRRRRLFLQHQRHWFIRDVQVNRRVGE